MKKIKGMMLLSFLLSASMFGCGGGGSATSISNIQTITRNETLSAYSTHLSSGRYGIIYRFIASSASEAKIVMSSDSLHCLMSVSGPSASNQFPSQTFSHQSAPDMSGNASISFTTAGKSVYYLIATTETPGITGAFSLTYPASLTLDGFENEIAN